MPIYLLKEKHAFRDPKRPYYGIAGDYYFCAVVEAINGKEAFAAISSEVEDPIEDWIIEELKSKGPKTIHLLGYGEY